MFSSWGVIFLLDPYDICIALCGPRFMCELSYKVLTLGWFWAVYLSYLILGRKEVQSSRCLVQQMPLRQKPASVLCFPVFPLSLSLWPLNNSYSVASSLTNLKWHFFTLLWGIFSCSQWEGQSGYPDDLTLRNGIWCILHVTLGITYLHQASLKLGRLSFPLQGLLAQLNILLPHLPQTICISFTNTPSALREVSKLTRLLKPKAKLVSKDEHRLPVVKLAKGSCLDAKIFQYLHLISVGIYSYCMRQDVLTQDNLFF